MKYSTSRKPSRQPNQIFAFQNARLLFARKHVCCLPKSVFFFLAKLAEMQDNSPELHLIRGKIVSRREMGKHARREILNWVNLAILILIVAKIRRPNLF